LSRSSLDYELRIHQASLSRTQPDETLDGVLTHSGDRVRYRVSLPFAATLPTHAWVHDTGSRDIRWRLLAAGADSGPTDWWPDNDASYKELLGAGDYELIIEATADQATYRLQLLASEHTEALSATGTNGRLTNARHAVVYHYDVHRAGDHQLQIATASASPVRWAIYDAAGRQVQGGDNLDVNGGAAMHHLVDLGELEVGRFMVILSSAAQSKDEANAGDGIDFSLALSATTLLPGDRFSGRLTDDEGMRSYKLHVPTGTLSPDPRPGLGRGRAMANPRRRRSSRFRRLVRSWPGSAG
jgi:hypothetical protein